MRQFFFLLLSSLLLTACSKKDTLPSQNPTTVPKEEHTLIDEKETSSTEKLSPHLLMAYIKQVDEMNPDAYVNFHILSEPLKKAKELVNNPKPSTTQEDINTSLDELRTGIDQLDDGSGFDKVANLPEVKELHDPFTFFHGDKVKSKEDWSRRADEIKRLFEYYMYGPLPSGETVSYTINEDTLTITVKAITNQRYIPYTPRQNTLLFTIIVACFCF